MRAFRSLSYRRWTSFMRTVAVAVTVTFLAMIVRPPQAAAQVVPPQRTLRSSTATPPPAGPDERYSSALTRLKEQVKAASRTPERPRDAHTSRQQLQAIRDSIREIERLEREADQSFSAMSKLLEERGIGDAIRERHRAADAAFKQKRQAMKAIMRKFEAADARNDDPTRKRSVQELHAFLAKHQPDRPQKKLDPKHLPWRTPKATVRKPATTVQTFRAGGPLAPAVSTAPLAAPPAAQAPSSPTSPEYLAETDNVQLTQAVRDLATALGRNPVRIFSWVRDNITFVPTFGSIQGSDVTLSKRAGNSFDTSSLLIALYRASGIPARYVHGTIEVPVAAAMNWVGGVATPEAAQQVLGQGGVPNALVVTGGRISAIQLEHVWVEAWIDFAPSRGQVNVRGDSWASLDASLKASTETPGLLAQANVPIDSTAIATGLLVGATVNDAEGWFQSPNTAVVDAAFGSYLRGVNTFIFAKRPAPTNGDVFGTRAIMGETSEVLPAGLPHRTIVVGNRYADVPAWLTHRFRYAVYASNLDRALGAPLVQFEDILPRLAGRRVTLLYAPASQADANLLASLLPKPHPDGSAPTAADFAAVRLPAYLIQLKPELRVDGVLRASGAAVLMGTPLPAVGAFTELDLASGWDVTEDLLTAGQVTAIGLDLQGTRGEKLDRLRARMEATKAAIDRSDYSNVTGELVAGDIATATIWSYFAEAELVERDTRETSGMIDVPALSYGLAHIDLEVTSAFGISQTARASGIVLDVGHLRHVRWSRDNDQGRWVRYNRDMGVAKSALEHQVPEQLFVSPAAPGQAVSTVRLLSMAVTAGQRIYTLTAANLPSALAHLALGPAVLSDISAAVAAGKEVTVHQQPLTVNGWTGVGYMVIDPATGAGAYLISGGASGGKLLLMAGGFLFGLFNAMTMVALIASVAVPVAGAAVAFALVASFMIFLTFAISMIMAGLFDAADYRCYAGGFINGFFWGFPTMAKMWMANVLKMAKWAIPGSVFWQCF